MMKILVKNCVLAALFLAPLLGVAQNKLSIDKVYSVQLRNSGPIISNNEVKGYFFFYQSDKIDRHTNEYTLQILDENVNKIKDIKFTDDKNVSLVEAAFNGTDLMFEFFNADEKMLDYRVYGLDGKKKFSYSQELSKKSIAWMKQKTDLGSEDDDGADNNSLFGLESDNGFVSIIPIRDGKQYTYQVSGYKTDKKGQWIYTPDDDDKMSVADYLGATDSVVVLSVVKKEHLMSKMQSWVVGIYLNNGKKAFEFETNSKDKYSFFPMNITQLKGTSDFALSGPYFEADDRALRDKSLGMGVWIMNCQGKLKNSKYSSWEADLAKYLPVSSKGRLDDIGYMYIHKVIQAQDGNIFAITEGYKKQVSAGGAALKVLALAAHSSGGNAMKLKITDLVVLQYDSTFKLTGAKIYEKNSNNVAMPSGGDFMSPQSMAFIAKSIGAFDYSFTEKTADASSFAVGYTDYIREDDYKGGTFNSITYDNGKFTTDRVNLKSKAKSLTVLPGKPGSILIVEYFKKEKRLDMHMEKMN